MSMIYSGEVTNEITSKKTYVTIPDDDEKTVVLECGDRSIEVAWRDLFLMLESSVHEWNRRAD